MYYHNYLVGGLVAIFYFPIYWVSNHPNWLSYFSEGWPNHQPAMCVCPTRNNPNHGAGLIATPELRRSPATAAHAAHAATTTRAEELQKSFTRRVQEVPLCHYYGTMGEVLRVSFLIVDWVQWLGCWTYHERIYIWFEISWMDIDSNLEPWNSGQHFWSDKARLIDRFVYMAMLADSEQAWECSPPAMNHVNRSPKSTYSVAKTRKTQKKRVVMTLTVVMVSTSSLKLSTGWWFGCHFLFSHILGIIIPIDFHIFQRGGPTTN